MKDLNLFYFQVSIAARKAHIMLQQKPVVTAPFSGFCTDQKQNVVVQQFMTAKILNVVNLETLLFRHLSTAQIVD